MKVIIIAALFVLAQTRAVAQVEKFKIFETASYHPSDAKLPTVWDDVSILMVLNLDKMKLHIYAKVETDIDIIEAKNNDKDKDGNAWIKYRCIDQEGLRCDIEWEVFRDQDSDHKYTMFLEYKNIWYVFRLKDD